MNADFRIDFLKTFDILLTPFGSIHGHFRVPWSHFGCKMEAKKHQIIEKVWVSRISHPISQNPLFLTPILLHYPPTLFAIFRPRPLQGPGASPRSIFPSPGDSGRLLGGPHQGYRASIHFKTSAGSARKDHQSLFSSLHFTSVQFSSVQFNSVQFNHQMTTMIMIDD